MKKIRVVLADDHVMLRSGLKLLLNSQMGIKVVGEASDGAEAVSITAELKPDVLLLDITMPNMGGFDALRTIKEKHRPYSSSSLPCMRTRLSSWKR